ncbi:MAG: alanine--tRNA ligase-related protein [Phycisphaerae bacterium]
MTFDAKQRDIVERTIHEVAAHRKWTIHALDVRSNHVHVVVSAPDGPEKVMTDFKAYCTRRLGEAKAITDDAKVWSRHGSTRYLWKPEDIAAACRYVTEAQGGELAKSSFSESIKFAVSSEDHGLVPLPDGRGSDRLAGNQMLAGDGTSSGGVISAADAFKLHDTYGFPIDLTQIMAEEKGLRVDIEGYERLMEAAREKARGKADHSDPRAKLSQCIFDAQQAEMFRSVSQTDDSAKYGKGSTDATIVGIVEIDAEGQPQFSQTGPLKPGHYAALLLDKTCFYGEQGGQVGDSGTIAGNGANFEVMETLRAGHVVAHLGVLHDGEFNGGQHVQLQLSESRNPIMQNHTATHVLNWALREALGEHVQQKGSLVDAEKTRFDFSNPKALTAEQVEKIEVLCQEQMRRNLAVYAEEVAQADAMKVHGLRAVFGEKYPERVRVVSVGVPVADLLANPGNADWRQYSIEFCGGTHVTNTSEIGDFLLTAEEAVSKGVRRVIGITGDAAKAARDNGDRLLMKAQELAKNPPAEAGRAVTLLQQEMTECVVPLSHRTKILKEMETLQEAAKKQQKAAAADAAGEVRTRVNEVLDGAPKIGDTTIVVAEMPDAPAEQLKHGADIVKEKCGSAAILFGVRGDEKATLLAAMTDDLVKRGIKAGDLVKAIAPIVNGGGGGPPTMAQAGGKDPSKLTEALAAGREWIEGKLNA